ncbi:hypothetical protein BGZ70_006656 [Mortierella alpina]|uniref:Uncharacterized protein n=1 Tax=Mortierella alpina TaxID=64518 RepID=A0A9P6J9R8_MORAP|nr:hypothetical protein BGZ70_006656 [Mortierella alpina]
MDSTKEHTQNATPAQETSDAENTQGAPTELIERDADTQQPILILTTENTGKLPIPGIAGVLRIGSDDNAERKFKRSTASIATLLSSSMVGTKDGGKGQLSKELQHSIYQQTTTSIPGAQSQDQPLSNDVLLPGSIRVETFMLNLERMDEWIIKLEANFSGMTGKKLFKRHECCIYLLDQCSIDWIPEVNSNEGAKSGWTVNMMTTQVRQVLRVPATEGIHIGMSFIMTAFQGDFTMKGAIYNLSEDKQTTQLVLWLGSEAENTLKLDRIRLELGLLGEHPQPKSTSP